MKNYIHLFLSKYLLIPIVITLAGCGGGSSDITTDSNESIRPIFLAKDVIVIPSATPTGIITDTTPTFKWRAIANASEYQYGHLNYESNQDTWREYKVLANDLNCINDICSDTPANYTFTAGENRAWWVRAKIDGTWKAWSDPYIFEIFQIPTNIGVANAIYPTGDISDTTPEFSWSSIQDSSLYQVGYENIDTRDWQQLLATKEQAGCLNTNQTCTFKPENQSFKVGERIAWWVRADVGGNWGEWSKVSVFNVIPKTNNNVIPEPIAPNGDVNGSPKVFSWSMVVDATEYILAYKETNTALNWQQYVANPVQATCANVNDTCTFTLPENTFVAGSSFNWRVRASVGGNLQEWSQEQQFKVINPQSQAGLTISEVLAVNTRTNLDPDFFDFSDWIELYNPTSQNIDVSNFGLSDDDDPLQWKFPENTIIAANSYLIVWADDEDKKANALHTNFKLSSKGESLTLADDNGKIIDSIEFGKQESDISTTKLLNAIVFMTPTPGAQNDVKRVSKDLSKSPTFSFESGFFNNAITVTLSQENDADIFFTTDGSAPTSNSQKYTQAININETSIIRAVGIETNILPSKVISNSYFINLTSNLPVVSLTIDPKYLFDPKIGIYTDGDGSNGIPLSECNDDLTQVVNYAQEWERPGHLEYFGNNRESEFSLTTGISISGQCSRQNEKKSFSIDLDSKYGTKTLEYKLFESKNVDKFKSFKFRTGSFGYELNDVLAASLTDTGKLNIDYQAYTATQLYVNGEYWGLYNVREKKGANFIVSNYPDIDKDDLDIINQGYIAKKGNTNDYFALEILLNDSLNLDLSSDTDYQSIIGKIDESNYIDYMALMIYSANVDWISSNQRSWKEKKADAKWRWMIDDADGGFYAPAVNLNYFNILSQSGSSDVMVSLFKALTKNTTFKQKFKSRFKTLLDTTFSPANMLNQINTLVDERYPYIPLENAKWGSINTGTFDRHVQNLKTFATSRNAIVRAQLDRFIP